MSESILLDFDNAAGELRNLVVLQRTAKRPETELMAVALSTPPKVEALLDTLLARYSVRALARLSGVPRSTLARIRDGYREPRITQHRRLVELTFADSG